MKIGVVVGRFQINQLHNAHHKLLLHAAAVSDYLICFIGVARARGTKRDPLDFETRRQMILSNANTLGKSAIVLPLLDQKYDTLWSKNLDAAIESLGLRGEVTLFHGRDSFVSCYSGKYKTREVDMEEYADVSATKQRRILAQRPANSSDFRAGVIYATENSFRSVFQCVDAAVVCKLTSEDYAQVLLGRKPDEKEWRFPGGFVDATDPSLEAAAARELFEETNVTVVPGNLQYVCSSRTRDWRYARTEEKIMTCLYAVERDNVSNVHAMRAGDDLAEVHWLELCEGLKQKMVPSHADMLDALLKWTDKIKSHN